MHSTTAGGKRHGSAAPAPLAMSPLPVFEGGTLRRTTAPDWGLAVGNVEDAKLIAESLRSLVTDAVFLDEEAYNSATHISQYQLKCQAQQRKIRDLENEVAALRAELERKEEGVMAATARHREAQTAIAELQQELENNQVVFQLHYQELMAKNEEIEKLHTIIDGLKS